MMSNISNLEAGRDVNITQIYNTYINNSNFNINSILLSFIMDKIEEYVNLKFENNSDIKFLLENEILEIILQKCLNSEKLNINEVPKLKKLKKYKKIIDYIYNKIQLELKNIKLDIFNDLDNILKNSKLKLDNIIDTIDGNYLNRDNYIKELEEKIAYSIFIITGDKGVGKSSIVKKYLSKYDDKFIFFIRGEEFYSTSLQELMNKSFNIKSNIEDLKNIFFHVKEKYLIIDSVEKVFETNNELFRELISTFSDCNFKIIIIIRESYLDNIKKVLLGSNLFFINIKQLSDDEINDLSLKNETIKNILEDNNLSHLNKNLFYLNQIYKIYKQNGKHIIKKEDIHNEIWMYTIRNNFNSRNGYPERREDLFLKIVLELIKNIKYSIVYKFTDSEYEIKKLLSDDSLIITNPIYNCVFVTHDIFIDIAIEIHFNRLYENNDKEDIINSIKDFPLLIEYYKNWLLENYNSKKISDEYLLELIKITSQEHYIQNKILCSIIESKCFNDFINNNKDIILNSYLENIIYTFVLSYNVQNKVLLVDKAIILLKFICDNIEDIDINNKLIELIFIFSNTIYNYKTDNNNNLLEKLSKIIYKILKDAIDKKCYNEVSIITIYKSIIKLSPYIKNEIEEFLCNINNLEFNHIPNLLIMDGEYSEIIAEYFPDELINLFFNNVIENSCKDTYNIIKNTYKVKYASGLVPPFYFLFKHHYKKAIDFIIRFSNLAAERYYEYFKDNNIYSNFTIYREIEENIIGDSFLKEYLLEDYVKTITFKLNDGAEISQIASSSLWSAYRGIHGMDNLLSSSLMAFENWLIDFINNENNKNDIENIYYKVLKESKSVLTTAVLASVGTGFLNIVKENIYPILKNIDCYFYDEHRLNHEHRNKWIIGYNTKKEYINEREKSFNIFWRQNTLKNCVLSLQMNFKCKSFYKILDELKNNNKNNKEILNFIVRLDVKNYDIYGIQNNQMVFKYKNSDNIGDIDNNIQNNSYISNLTDIIQLKKDSSNINSQVEFNYIIDKINSIDFSKYNTYLKLTLQIEAFVVYKNIIENIYSRNYKIENNQLNQIIDFIIRNIIYLSFYSLEDNTSVLPLIYKYYSGNKNDIIKIIIYSLLHKDKKDMKYFFIGIYKYLFHIENDLTKKIIKFIIEIFNENIVMYSEIDYIIIYHKSLNDYIKIDYDTILVLINNIKLSNNCDESFNIDINNINCCKDNLFMLYSIIIIFVEQDLTYLKYIEDILKTVVNSSIKYSDIVMMDYNTFEYIEKSLSQYILKLGKNRINNIITILKDACHKQPYLVFKLLLYLEEVCEANNKFSIFWYVYSKISNTVKEIANSSNQNMDYSHKVLLRHMLFTEVPWQKNDLENKYIKHGKIYIVDYAKNTYSNIDTLIGMIKLMFYFNSIFFEDFISLLSKIDEKIYDDLDKILYVCLIKSIEIYLFNSNNLIYSKIFKSILTVLNILIKKDIPDAYLLKLFLLKTKKMSN